MLKRYIGPAEEVEVMLNGVSFGIVQNGEAIPVPDDLADSVSWSETLWEDADASALKDENDNDTTDNSELDSPADDKDGE